MGRHQDRYFSKEDIQMANRHVKKMLNTTSHQRNVNQSHNEYHLSSVRMAIIKKTRGNKC